MDGRKLKAFAGVEMSGQELEGIALRLGAPFTIPGSVEFQPPAPKVANPVRGVALLVNVIVTGYNSGPLGGSASVDKNGTFRIENVYEGRYEIKFVPPWLDGYYLASIKAGDREVLGEQVDLSSGSLPITIIYRGDGGSVRGIVSDCAGGAVVLLPLEERLRAGFARTQPCGPNGRFEITSVRPGEYYALAFNDLEMIRVLDSGARDSIRDKAVPVRVRPGEPSTLDLRVTEPW